MRGWLNGTQTILEEAVPPSKDGHKSNRTKYNFNDDKSSEQVYGFSEGDESWETLNNTGDGSLFKAWPDPWTDDFEGRYPDGNEEITNLKSFVEEVASWGDSPTKAKVEAVANIQSALFYWLYTEFFLQVDSRAKNAFPTRFVGDRWAWVPYDMDTSIGINNEGTLSFDYHWESGDFLPGGAKVFNGADHRFWLAIQQLYQDELKTMYSNLRAGGFNYDFVKNRFDSHQSKWPEAVFNEDAQYKYIDPLITSGDEMYLPMVQGSKKSQRDWWISNRFKYMDSKYNVADNLTERITVRAYAKADVSVTPCIDMYSHIRWGSVDQTYRSARNESHLFECPIQPNDTECYIFGSYSIKNVTGLEGLHVGFADFTKAPKIEEIILGSAAEGYQNYRLETLNIGSLKLLKKIDCRNCVSLASTPDASGCSGLEEVYFEGSAITGIQLPNGGLLRTVHLPATVTNLTIRNQKKLTDLQVASYANISTFWIENSSVDPFAMLPSIQANARVRIVGYDLGTKTADELDALMLQWDAFRGLSETGETMDKAQIICTVHVGTATGAKMAEWKAKYPLLEITYDHLSCTVKYYSEDGSILLTTEEVLDGGDATYSGTPTKPSTAQYTYSFDGWSATIGGPVWTDAKKRVTTDRILYAHFAATIRRYTVYFYNGSTLLQTVPNVPYGGSATYTGETPVDPSGAGLPFTGWNPSPSGITGNTSCYAQFKKPIVFNTISTETISANAVFFLNDRFIKSYNGENIRYSLDGYSWSYCSGSSLSGGRPLMTYANGAYYISGYEDSYLYSTDGMSFQKKSFGFTRPDSSYPWAIASHNGRITAISGKNNNAICIYSDDGVTWLEGTVQHLDKTYGFYEIANINGKMISTNSNAILISDDGMNWSIYENPNKISASYAYKNMFLGKTSSGERLYKSTDGVNWTLIDYSINNYTSPICGEKFILFHNNGYNLRILNGDATGYYDVSNSDKVASWGTYSYGKGVYVRVSSSYGAYLSVAVEESED